MIKGLLVQIGFAALAILFFVLSFWIDNHNVSLILGGFWMFIVERYFQWQEYKAGEE